MNVKLLPVALVLALSGCLAFHAGALPDEPKGETFVEVEGARVHFRDVEVGATAGATRTHTSRATPSPEGRPTQEAAKGPAVVLLHGFASSLETWRMVAPKLEGRRVLSLDLKGFGWTDRPEGDYSPKAQAALVYAFMKERGVSHAAVVAHSWGSSVALQLALDHPEAVERVALYDAWVYESQLPSTFHFARASGVGEVLYAWFYKERPEEKLAFAFYDPHLITEEMVEGIESQLARPGTTAAALAAVRGQRYDEVETRYGEVKVPVLLLWGREDRITTLSYGERLSKQLPRSRLVVYPQCGHFPMLEAASASTAELVRFLSEDVK